MVGALVRSTATTLEKKDHVAREVWSMPANVSLADSLSFDRRAQVSWQFTVGLRVKGKARPDCRLRRRRAHCSVKGQS